jgi:hypothetical protein
MWNIHKMQELQVKCVCVTNMCFVCLKPPCCCQNKHLTLVFVPLINTEAYLSQGLPRANSRYDFASWRTDSGVAAGDVQEAPVGAAEVNHSFLIHIAATPHQRSCWLGHRAHVHACVVVLTFRVHVHVWCS